MVHALGSMNMSSKFGVLEQELKESIRSLLEDAETVLIINPAQEVFQTVTLIASEFEDDLPDIQVLANPDVMKSAVEDFILASQIADLLNQGSLSLRTITDIERNSLLVSDEKVVAIVPLTGELTGITTADDDFVEKVQAAFMDEWEAGDEFTVRTPPLSHVRETLRENFGADVEDDFLMLLESVDTIPGEDDELDEVTIALLVGAHHNVLLYDISKWGEDTGVASKATFSRTKTRLEDRGVIDTEKVPIEVGRPRLRLQLILDDLHDVNNLAEQVSA